MSVGSFIFNIEVVLDHIKMLIMYYSNKMDSGYYIGIFKAKITKFTILCDIEYLLSGKTSSI